MLAGAPAHAVTGFPVAGYGFDGQPHVIVGGGSDTTFAAMLSISQLYSRSGLSGCGPLHSTTKTSINECTGAADQNKNLGDYQGDTIAQANPAGSGAGINSLNGVGETGALHTTYEGTVNTISAGQALTNCINQTTLANVDFGRSSRGPNTSGGNVATASCGGTGNERAADTFWGYARDGIEWMAFNNRRTFLNQNHGGVTGLTPAEIRGIYDCSIKNWSDIARLGIAVGAPTDGPIVAWTMNPASGTRSTGVNFLINQGGAPAGFNPDTQTANGGPCVQHLGAGANGVNDDNHAPLENDIKQLVFNAGHSLSNVATSRDNPENWVWWGSFGVFTAFPFTSKVTNTGSGLVPTVTGLPIAINGILPSASRVFNDTLGAGLGRTLFHVTRKSDADCPHAAPGDGTCDFSQPGAPTIPNGAGDPAVVGSRPDLNVTGGSSGIPGAIREFTRFLCRLDNTQQGLDPLTGANYDSELTNAINGAGFQTLNVSLQTTGSRCQVNSL
jgi:ABC-type phosphate transport system substrate-binding protein